MKSLPFISLAALLICQEALPSTFTTSGRAILLDGQPFAVRGVCYQPAAIGENPSAAPPYGDYFTAAYAERADRDIANLRKLGANVVRVYGWTIGADHTVFLDQLHNGGDRSIYLLVNRYINPATDWSNAADVTSLESEWVAIANEVKNHPAVMGFLIGNEVNAQNGNGWNPAFWSAMNRIAGAVKAVAPGKLVSVAITDEVWQVGAHELYVDNFDFWGIQVYRGTSFGTFFADYAAVSMKPLIVTEFGYDAYNHALAEEYANDAAFPADVMEELWNELRLNQPVAAGACVFEYADEWWKSGNPSTHDDGGWPNEAFPDGYANEEWWGIFRAVDNGSQPDILEPRGMFYRLAAMWNAPHPLSVQTGSVDQSLQVTFSYPMHLRDQPLELELSKDLSSWTRVADNSASRYLSSYNPAVAVTSTEAGERVEVTVLRDPTISAPTELLTNAGFETGNSSGWMTGGTVVTPLAQAGLHALQLAAAGGYSVPLAYQVRAAAPGEEFNLSGYMYAATALPTGATFGLLKIVFEDASGNDLEPASVSIGRFGPPDNPGAESLPTLTAASPVGAWHFTEAQAVAPAGTVSVSFFILNVDELPNTMYFDSLSAIPVEPAGSAQPRVFFRLNNATR